MIISHGRKFIFVHIPKTGGTSMALALEDRAMADDILVGDTPKAVRRRGRLKRFKTEGRLWKHSRLSDIAGLVEPEALDEYFIFTMVRNPWERVVSLYFWARAQTFNHPAVRLASELSFEAYLCRPEIQAMLRRDQASDYVTDQNGHEKCDAYLRLEHPDDLSMLTDHLGFDVTMPHVNASHKPSDYHSVHTEQTAEIVAALFADDISRFGYRF